MRANASNTYRAACRVAACAGLLLGAQRAIAAHVSGFEAPTYAGNAAGIDLNGQDLYYNPDPAASISCDVYTYAGNALGLPANPGGGDQFVAGTGPAGAIYARSQRDIVYGGGTGVWRASFDVAITFTGVAPLEQNIGSFSTQPLDINTPTNAGFIALARWTNPADPASTWNADFVYFDAANAFVITTVPDPGFQNLALGHWYRWTTKFDFDANLVTEVSITDLTTGVTATHHPVNWYLAGGMAGGLPAPTGFRFFAGAANVAGNTFAVDNLFISCLQDIDGDGIVGITDLVAMLGRWGASPGNPADLDGDGVVGIGDLIDLLGHWGPCG